MGTIKCCSCGALVEDCFMHLSRNGNVCFDCKFKAEELDNGELDASDMDCEAKNNNL